MIRSIRVENLFQHAGLSCEWGPGMIVITAPNGRGKSNLLAALAFGLSGDTDWIRGGVAPGSRAATTIRFQPIAGSWEIAELTRRPPVTLGTQRRGGERILTFRGQSWTSDRDVADVLTSWWGCSPTALTELAFCRQGRLTELADARPADRARDVAVILGLDAAETVYDVLGEVRPPAARPPDREPERLRWESELAVLAARLADEPVTPAQVQSAERAWREAEERGRWYRDWVSWWEESAKLESDVRQIQEQLDQVTALLQQTEWAESAQTTWQDWLAYQQLQDELTALDQQRVDPGPAPPPAERPSRLAELESQQATLQRLVRLDPDACCPTCGAQPTAELAQAIVHARAQWAEYQTLAAAFAAAQSAAAAARAEWEQRVHQERYWRGRVDALRARLAERGPPPTLPAEPAVFHAQLSHAWHRRQEGLEQLRRLTAQHQQWSGRQTAWRDRRERLMASAPEGVGAPSAADAAAAAAEADQAAVAGRAAFQQLLERRMRQEADRAEYARVEAAHARCLQQLQEDRAAAAQAEVQELWFARCRRVREALHRDAAPRRAAREFLTAVGRLVDGWLAACAAAFRLVESDGWFEADFGSARYPLARLSGAEKLLFGLAWRLALLDAGASRFGTLFLDEPTYGLDQIRRKALVRALRLWRERAGDRQLVVVTHDDALAEVADTLVRFG